LKLEFHPLGTVGSGIWKRMDLRMTCRQSPVDIEHCDSKNCHHSAVTSCCHCFTSSL